MSRIHPLVLRVREADESDYGKSVIRIHKANKPLGINWGDQVNLSLDRKNWITCQLEPAGKSGTEQIYIGIHLRGILNKDTVGSRVAQIDVPGQFYIRKAASKTALYITITILVIIAVAFLVYLFLEY